MPLRGEAPPPPTVKCPVGSRHTVAIPPSGGAVESLGKNDCGQANVPPLPPGRHFTHVAAGADHTVYLMDDGHAIAAGSNMFGETTLPQLPEFRKYVAVACGERHTVLLQDDGRAVAFGRNMFGETTLPE